MFDLNLYKLFIKSRCTLNCCDSVLAPVPVPVPAPVPVPVPVLKLEDKRSNESETEVEIHYRRHTNG